MEEKIQFVREETLSNPESIRHSVRPSWAEPGMAAPSRRDAERIQVGWWDYTSRQAGLEIRDYLTVQLLQHV